ncbi:glycosyltransferase family 4 protein [Archangium violaceum]|uniref:glycosyltransferase family 4 protein n=1 Tax=Archangium violaceum TaxID=83451 RepID=UPI002B2DC54A|nr:glycosyltransferase family 4 protein [Archangium violaceum]
MPSRPRILFVGQAVRPTGYARVLTSLLERLHLDFELLHFGINYRGPVLEGAWRTVPNAREGDILGREQLPALLEDFRPALVFFCHDAGLWPVHREAVRRAPGAPRAVFYCPIEWPFPRASEAEPLRTLDQLVAYTGFGHRVLEEAFDRLELEAGAPRSRPRLHQLPHGVDTTRFQPLGGDVSPEGLRAGRVLARRALFPGRPELEHAFLVLNANRNCPRKRVDLTLRAFADFARDKPDVWLYLHMGLRDVGVDILARAHELGIAHRLLLTPHTGSRPDSPDAQLNLVYNACDVGLNTATAEGWGLVAFEHAATGAAQVVPAHSACRELWREHGLLVPTLEPPDNPSASSATFNVIDTRAAAACLERLYWDRALLAEQSRRAYLHASAPCFHWDTLAARWRDLFLQVLGLSPWSSEKTPSLCPSQGCKG